MQYTMLPLKSTGFDTAQVLEPVAHGPLTPPITAPCVASTATAAAPSLLLVDPYAEMVFLGTSAAIPSKYRNGPISSTVLPAVRCIGAFASLMSVVLFAVSCVFMRLGDGKACLFDCGEGSWHQLTRVFGVSPASARKDSPFLTAYDVCDWIPALACCVLCVVVVLTVCFLLEC